MYMRTFYEFIKHHWNTSYSQIWVGLYSSVIELRGSKRLSSLPKDTYLTRGRTKGGILNTAHPIYNSLTRHGSSAFKIHSKPDCFWSHYYHFHSLSHYHLLPELCNGILTGPAASTVVAPLQSVFCQWPDPSSKKSISSSFLAFNSPRASSENHHNGKSSPTPSGPCLSLWPASATPLGSTLPHCPPVTLASLFFSVHPSRVPVFAFAVPSGWNALSSDIHIASFLSSFRHHHLNVTCLFWNSF